MAQFGVENKDVLLALSIAAGASASAAARELDIPLRTAQRRTTDPEFRRLVSDLRGEMVSTALGRMTDNLTRAADAVATLLDAEDPAIRLRAARAMFTFGLRLRETVDLADRVRSLEEELTGEPEVGP